MLLFSLITSRADTRYRVTKKTSEATAGSSTSNSQGTLMQVTTKEANRANRFSRSADAWAGSVRSTKCKSELRHSQIGGGRMGPQQQFRR